MLRSYLEISGFIPLPLRERLGEGLVNEVRPLRAASRLVPSLNPSRKPGAHWAAEIQSPYSSSAGLHQKGGDSLKLLW
jgi:hypothetical protein